MAKTFLDKAGGLVGEGGAEDQGCITRGDNNNASVEIMGARPYQEDAHTSTTLDPRLAALTKEERIALLERTLEEVENQVEDNTSIDNMNIGATAMVSICHMRPPQKEGEPKVAEVTYANLGDSNLFACVIGPDGKVRQIERLNEQLHKPSDPQETAIIQGKGGFVRNGRLFGNLAVSRALGDNGYRALHTPSVGHREIPLKGDEKLLLFTTCDGVVERTNAKSGMTSESAPDVARFKKMIEDNYTDDLGELSRRIASDAHTKYFSQDNITVMAQLVTETSPPVLTSLFDGHGPETRGEQVAKFAAEVINGIAQKELNEEIKKKGLELQTEVSSKEQLAPSQPVAAAASSSSATVSLSISKESLWAKSSDKPELRPIDKEDEGHAPKAGGT